MELIRINDQAITANDLVLHLKFNDDLNDLLDRMVKDRLLLLGAKKAGISVTTQEVQSRADELRRVLGLLRASDVYAYLDRLQITVDEFEDFVSALETKRKMTEHLTNDGKVEAYFKLNSPKFDTVTLGHIGVVEKGLANEIVAKLEDDPKQFPTLAQAHSIFDTAVDGGLLGTVRRGQIDPKIEGKIFNAGLREPIGPLGPESGPYDIFMVLEKTPAVLDDYTTGQVRRALLDDWFTETVKEVSIA